MEAVLALVIERPSYGYDLWRRFQSRFGHLYPIGSARVYQVLDQLLDQGLIEHVPPHAAGRAPGRQNGARRSLRQPKPCCRATGAGARRHREWLASSFADDDRRHELLRRLLATSARDARTLLQIVDIYERACLDDMARAAQIRAQSEGSDLPAEGSALRDLLIAEERRLAHEARLKFIAFARRHLRAELEGGDAGDE